MRIFDSELILKVCVSAINSSAYPQLKVILNHFTLPGKGSIRFSSTCIYQLLLVIVWQVWRVIQQITLHTWMLYSKILCHFWGIPETTILWLCIIYCSNWIYSKTLFYKCMLLFTYFNLNILYCILHPGSATLIRSHSPISPRRMLFSSI